MSFALNRMGAQKVKSHFFLVQKMTLELFIDILIYE